MSSLDDEIAALKAEIAEFVAKWKDPEDRADKQSLLSFIDTSRKTLNLLLKQQAAAAAGAAATAAATADAEVYVKFGKHSNPELFAVPSVQVSDILKSAKENFHSEGGILWREVQPGNFLRCIKERVPNNCVLSFEPEFHNAKFKYKTLSRAKSLRLLAKQAAKTIGKVGGIASRVSGILVEVEVHAVDSKRIEDFIAELEQSIVIEGEVKRWVDYGILHGRFVVAPYNDGIARSDCEDSYEHEDNVPSESSLHFYA